MGCTCQFLFKFYYSQKIVDARLRTNVEIQKLMNDPNLDLIVKIAGAAAISRCGDMEIDKFRKIYVNGPVCARVNERVIKI